MSKLEIIPKLDSHEHGKCKTCTLTKITRLSFPKLDRNSQKIELIQSDLCNMHVTPIKGKNYFVMFIDNPTQYCCLFAIY